MTSCGSASPGIRRFISVSFCALVINGVGSAAAQTYDISIAQPNIGRLVSGRDDTVFRFDPASGNAVRISGSGSRLTTSSGDIDVTISCGLQASCLLYSPQVTISPLGSPLGRALDLRAFTVATGSARITSGPSQNGASISFGMSPIGINSSKSFSIGYDFSTVGDDSGKPSGQARTGFLITISRLFGAPLTSSGFVQAIVFRGLTTSLISNLSFGKVVRPYNGDYSLVYDAATETLGSPPGIIVLRGAGITLGRFQVRGEGGQNISISVPASLSLDSGSGSIQVSFNTKNAGSQTLSSALGSAGSVEVAVGGRISISSSTPSGYYSGQLVCIIQYN